MELEKASYPEALKMLARRYNIEVQEKERTPEEIAAATAKEGLGNLVVGVQMVHGPNAQHRCRQGDWAQLLRGTWIP